jgi:serine/threonine protein kinase
MLPAMKEVSFGDWEPIAELGAGGQGKVYKVRKPARTRTVNDSFDELLRLVLTCGNNTGGVAAAKDETEKFVTAIQNLASDPASDLAALKRFDIPDRGEEAEKAVRRLEREIEALHRIDEPAILKLLEGNVEQRWIATEYHPGGTLARHPERYKGDALAALKAFRPLVAAVARLTATGSCIGTSSPITSSSHLTAGWFWATLGLCFSVMRLAPGPLRPSRR